MASSLTGSSSSPLWNIHSDVLNATPDTEESKMALVEELKRRARGSIGARNYPEAEVLYSKAIDTCNNEEERNNSKDLAVLLTNRSLARYSLHKLEGSVQDAQRATKLDPTYVKAYWRLGQGLVAQEHYTEALAAYQTAANLEPQNKALRKEIELTELKRLKQEQQPTTTTTNGSESSARSKENNKATSATKQSSTIKESRHTGTAEMDNDVVQFTASEAVRGYKIVDGKKTSYFHREISEEEKRLIGDIAPKKIEQEENVNVSSAPVVEGTSAWNTAGTWEEKDVTQWATDTLRAALLATTYTLPAAATAVHNQTTLRASIPKVPKLSGHASVATVRGKRRYIYEFAITLDWELPLSNDNNNKVCRGSLTFPDVDCTGEYEISDYSVHPDSPPEARHLLEQYIQNNGLRNEITNTLKNWVKLFEATYSI
mmetsp:Transcript_5551/g.8187  ORF Transcript_5551/g.8187 Transcript_5551/m.8187 type:complete len:430 (+) Transcript_5551:33-1322(+)